MEWRFGILGPLQVSVDGRSVAVSAGRLRTVLAVLLLRANRPVSLDEMADRVWGAALPVNIRATLQTSVMRLRKTFAAADGGARLVQTQAGGYLIEVQPDCLDVTLFEASRRRASESAAAGDTAREESHLREGLALWRGPALAGIDADGFIADEAVVLDEERLQVAERLYSLWVDAGRHVEAVAPLLALTAERRFRERLWYLLMLALYRSGRQAEALQAFRTVQRHLAAELGIEPGPELRTLQHAVLNQNVDMTVRPAGVAV
jgi:DNA-binding SARP family transcriptional activator